MKEKTTESITKIREEIMIVVPSEEASRAATYLLSLVTFASDVEKLAHCIYNTVDHIL
jgi:hypothetical protein